MVERTDCWRSIDNAPQRAVAIFNYNVSGTMYATRLDKGEVSLWHLPLQIGETFLVTHQSDDWYYGHSLTNAEHAGVVPKSYVCLRKGIHSKPQSPIVEEATAALREWNAIFKEKYLKGDNNFRLTKDIMRDVMSTRSTIVSGKMTVDEEKEARKKIISKMNFLNKSLGLDLVVRDANGLVLSPDKTSVVALYRHHLESSEKHEQQLLNKPKEEVEMSNSFRILLQIINFNPPKVSEAVDLIISIYELSDSKFLKPVCENFIVKGWNKQNFDEKKNTRVQFGDISKNDIANKKLYLVCNVVTEGNYNNKSSTNLVLGHDSEKKGLNFRKPVGVAALDITDQFTFKQGKASQLDGGIEQELTCPYLAGSSNENESWETTFKKLVTSDKKGVMENGLFVKISIKFGENLLGLGDHPIHQSAPHNRTLIAKKLGLPEVILPSDVRNDLYVNLYGGEFSRLEKRQDRNIEITVEAIASNGSVIPSCLSGGVQKDAQSQYSQYHSVVYYHDGKPRWNEVVKLEIPEDFFESTHLRFTFRHRSRNDTKEKSAPWAMSFLKLVNDEDRTAISDHSHDLVVYKLDKKFDFDNDLSYLQLPHFKSKLQTKLSTVMGLTPLPKDVFTVQTTLASTKLTQNEGLLSLLKSKSEPDNLERNLKIFDEKVECNEFVKFIPDVLDTLFSILMEHQKGEPFDKIVFKNLVKVILMITEDLKYQLFLPVLEKYIQEYFSATLAHGKILSVLKEVAENAVINARDFSLAMKCLRYVFKFVVRSRVLFASLNKGAGREHFEENMKGVLESLARSMFYKIEELQTAQSNCLKHMVESIPDLITVFSPSGLAELLMQMLASLPQSHLSGEKIQTIKGIVQSPLFERQDCRSLMLPRMVDTLGAVFKEYQINTTMTNLCNETLGDILDGLSKCESISEDISQISQKCLRSVIESVARRKVNGNESNIQTVVANMISIFRKMGPEHYESYVKKMNVSTAAGLNDLKDFVMELLVMFRDLVQNTVFPEDWNTMIMVQNSVISKALCQVAHFIRDYLLRPFELDPWKSFFESAICFITQPFLQVEKFSETKQLKILSQYGDMRKIMGYEVHQMWINLGQHKTHFIPHLVGNILEMTLVPEKELREATIPIFFDMMQCEYYASKNGHDLNETKRDSTIINGNFSSTEEAIVLKLDHFVADKGLGDEHYRYLFRNTMRALCNNHSFIRELGLNFVQMVSKLMKILLEYRAISLQDSKENQMSCCVLLLDFYHERGRKELYVKYLKKLIVLHENCENWAEAGFTLLQYANLLSFTNEPLVYPWKKHPQCTTQKMLKENLYKDILSNFEKGLMWESAIQICKELATLYETETFEYTKLSELLNTMSKMYSNIVNEERLVPEYFRVAFYGRGYPAFLQNKVFVYRGKICERLKDFQDRMQDKFPNAELMLSLHPPTEEQKSSPHQLMQINSVDPVMVERKSFKDKDIHNNIIRYYKAHEVNIFSYSRPYFKDKEKEAENLWIERTILTTRSAFPGILQWFPLANPPEVIELSPIEVAIETMVKTNDDLRSIVNDHKMASYPSLQILTMKLNGIIDAAVNGGTAKYEQAFFSDEYVKNHPDDALKIETLKNLIADQIPILGFGIKIHGLRKTDDIKPLHDRFEAIFKEMKINVERKYGARKDYAMGSIEFKTDVQKETQRSTTDLSSSQSNTISMINLGESNSLSVSKKGWVPTIRKKASTCKDEKPKIAITNNHISSNNRENSPETSSPMLRDMNARTKEYRFGSVTSSTGSRPTSGQYLQSITPNHSRSPSTTSNRDSAQSTEGSNGGHIDPPPVPPKSKSESCEETSVDVTDHTLTASRRKIKKPPPPPPPISPPKKPPMVLIE